MTKHALQVRCQLRVSTDLFPLVFVTVADFDHRQLVDRRRGQQRDVRRRLGGFGSGWRRLWLWFGGLVGDLTSARHLPCNIDTRCVNYIVITVGTV